MTPSDTTGVAPIDLESEGDGRTTLRERLLGTALPAALDRKSVV